MNVYDFDKTICRDDTEEDFFKYMIFHHPINLLKAPYYINARIQYKLKNISEEEYRHRTYLILKGIKDIKSEVNKFWSKRKKKMMKWYLSQKKEDDLIITATPRFLLEDIFKELNIKHYIPSEFDLNSRRFIGKINSNEEKVKNFLKSYKKEDIDNFYTDSLIDLPMIRISKTAYIIRKEKPILFKE